MVKYLLKKDTFYFITFKRDEISLPLLILKTGQEETLD